MNVTLDYDVWISFFDLIIIGLMLFGAYRGVTLGAIVQSIALGSIFLGLTICVNISKGIYRGLSSRSDVPDLFAMVVMALLFVGVLILTGNIAQKVRDNIKDAPIGPTNKALGAILGAFKYFLIASVFLVAVFKVEQHAKFLPNGEKASKMSRASIAVVTSIFPYLKMDKKTYKQFDYPDDNNQSK